MLQRHKRVNWKKKTTKVEFEKVKRQTISTGRLQISKRKELVSATAVSFRHARALVFSFGATFFIIIGQLENV